MRNLRICAITHAALHGYTHHHHIRHDVHWHHDHADCNDGRIYHQDVSFYSKCPVRDQKMPARTRHHGM